MHSRVIADLRGHRLTQKRRNSKYVSKDLTLVAREASKVLSERRAKIAASIKMTPPSRRRCVPDPGSTRGKQNTSVQEPRQKFEHEPSMLSREVYEHEIEDVSKDDSEDMDDLWKELCDFGDRSTDMVDSDPNKYIDPSKDEEAESNVEVNSTPTAELDDYDVEMARAFEEQAEPASKRNWESTLTPEIYTAELSGHVDQDGKRRKVVIEPKSSQLPSPVIRKKARKYQSGKLQPTNLWIRSGSLAAVFEAALATEALKAQQEDSFATSEKAALGIDLLGEEPRSPEQTHASVQEDLTLTMAETLYMTGSVDDLRVAEAAAILQDIHRGGTSVFELDSTDRDALGRAFGTSDDLQPSMHGAEPPAFDVIPRTAKFSDHFETTKSLIRGSGKFTRYGKPTKPSEKFQSFFATRRLRKNVLRQDKKSWSDEDQAFVLSGKTIEEPGAELGAEFVAKSLLDVSNTVPLMPSGMF